MDPKIAIDISKFQILPTELSASLALTYSTKIFINGAVLSPLNDLILLV